MRNAPFGIGSVIATALVSCGAGGGDTAFGGGSDGSPDVAAETGVTGGSGGTPGDAATDPVSDAVADAETGVADADAADVGFGYDSPVADADACAAVVVEGKPPPLAMYLMLDRSGSMTFSNKWQIAIDGVQMFVEAPVATGTNVALQYFPLDAGHDCAGGAYAVPEVPMGTLPGHAQAIVDSLSAAAPEGTTTPMEGALNGLVQFTASYAAVPPGSQEKVVALLITDGMPDGDCDNDTASLAAIAGAAWAGSPSIPTYVVGMSGADFGVLGEIASAGGTAGAYSVTTGGASAFLAVLEEIRADAVGCSFVMPNPEAGTVDLDQVEVSFESSSGSSLVLPRVADGASCGIGWHFDDNAGPSAIELCPSTCNLVKADPQGAVAISLGCLGA